MIKEKKRRKKVGIALGSGSARGWAHIGVFKALDEENIQIDYIAGTSIGALVGSVYAEGNIKSLEKFAKSITWKTIISYLDITLPINGLISGKRVSKLLTGYFSNKKIEALNIPFCCVAVDITTGKEVRINSGRIVDAIRSSISIPGIFTPFEKDKRYFVDGGVINPLPVNVVREMGAETVIAVDLNNYTIDKKKLNIEDSGNQKKIGSENISIIKKNRDSQIIQIIEEKYFSIKGSIKNKFNHLASRKSIQNIFEIIANSTYIMQKKITQCNLSQFKPDILIQPELDSFKLFDFDRAEVAINEGYDKTKQIIVDLKKKIN
ncbi:MAG: patatin-like phospholipase family protein [Candidatus Aminicenantes bacterium]|nr:patatin-like phospholipase family protein [Candidatus Aminicenantes bacterium]